MSCFICPNGKGKMCSGPCGLGCIDCPGEPQLRTESIPRCKFCGTALVADIEFAAGCCDDCIGRE